MQTFGDEDVPAPSRTSGAPCRARNGSLLPTNAAFRNSIAAFLMRTRAFPTRNGASLTRNRAFLRRNGAFLTRNRAFLTRNEAFLTRTRAFLTRTGAFLARNRAFPVRFLAFPGQFGRGVFGASLVLGCWMLELFPSAFRVGTLLAATGLVPRGCSCELLSRLTTVCGSGVGFSQGIRCSIAVKQMFLWNRKVRLLWPR